MAEIKGYAFDIEGTLYKNGKLQKGVLELFKVLSQTGKPIMFISGMNYNEVMKVVSTIKRESNTSFNPIIASNAGSYIYDKEIKSFPLSADKVTSIRKTLNLIAPGSMIIYRTALNNYREKILDTDSKLKSSVTLGLVSILDSLHKIEIDAVPVCQKYLNSINSDNQILSLEIIIPSNSKKAKFVNELEYFKQLHITNSASVQVSTMSKWQALKNVFGDSAKDVCYFGDNFNDVECLKNCDRAILCNSTKSEMFDVIETEQKLGKNKYATINLSDSELLKYVTGQNYSRHFMENLTSDAKSIVKDLKKEKSL